MKKPPDPGLKSLRVRFPRKKRAPREEPGRDTALAQFVDVTQALSREVRALRRDRVSPSGVTPGPTAVLPALARKPKGVQSPTTAIQTELPALVRKPKGIQGPAARPQAELPMLERKPRGVQGPAPTHQTELPTLERKPKGPTRTPGSPPVEVPQLARKPKGPKEEEHFGVVAARLNEAVQALGDRVDKLQEI